MKKFLSISLIASIMVVLVISLAACGDKEENSSENSEKSGNSSSSSKNGFIEKTDEETLSRVETDVFNKKFKEFEGTEKSADNVKELIDKILMSNYANPNKMIAVKFNGESFDENEEIKAVRESFVSSQKYSISFVYNEKGAIDTAVITEE